MIASKTKVHRAGMNWLDTVGYASSGCRSMCLCILRMITPETHLVWLLALTGTSIRCLRWNPQLFTRSNMSTGKVSSQLQATNYCFMSWNIRYYIHYNFIICFISQCWSPVPIESRAMERDKSAMNGNFVEGWESNISGLFVEFL